MSTPTAAIALLLLSCSRPGPADPKGDPGPAAGGEALAWGCLLGGESPDYAMSLGCEADFGALADNPYDASIPGAWTVKTVIDRLDHGRLFFTNTVLYPLHWQFATAHRSGNGLPFVPDQSSFNSTEYYSPDRRFLLGAVTYYEEPQVWTYELSPYDTASADLIAEAFYSIQSQSYYGDRLVFHPTSTALERVAEELPANIPVMTNAELYAGITYQPLNLGTAMGLLRFYTESDLAAAYVNYREIVVLDEIPLDISVVAGIITDDFQTPLSHINVLAQNRGTPNMALTGAFADETLRGLEDQWVELVVGSFEYSIRGVSEEEAQQWWEENRPEPIEAIPMDLDVTALTDCETLLDLDTMALPAALDAAFPAFGGKATHFGGLARIGDEVISPDAFAIPVFYYHQHLEENGLWPVIDEMLADPTFAVDPAYRAERLDALQSLIVEAPINADFEAAVIAKIRADYGGGRIKFRSSTTAEDLGDFTGAGLYESKAADPDDPDDPVDVAIKEVWASLWGPRAFEEREYWGINHRLIGMAELVHPSHTAEEANGVAITANIFDTSGLEPAFYINVQSGETSVVIPEEGLTSDQLLYYYNLPGQPAVYLDHSSLIVDGTTVMTPEELYELGRGLQAIHNYFYEAYGTEGGWYAMDTEFKVERYTDGTFEVSIKQARPYPGRGE
jgi:hypothetical protein